MAPLRITALALLLLGSGAMAEETGSGGTITSYGISTFGDLKYPSDFKHFDYADPDAAQGGTMVFRGTGASQTFDSLNPFILKGEPAQGLGLLYDSLLTGSLDEPDSAYGLVASALEYPPDRSWVTFTMRPEATFSDGQPITAEDVVFTVDVLREKGSPTYQMVLKDIAKVEALDPTHVKFTFREDAPKRDLPGLAGGLSILPKHYYDTVDFAEFDDRAAGRLRSVRRRGGRSRQVDQVLQEPRLLGKRSSGGRRHDELRLHHLSVLRRQQCGLRSLQGRRCLVPAGIFFCPLGHRLQLSGRGQGVGEA